jgi:hypothetical protein
MINPSKSASQIRRDTSPNKHDSSPKFNVEEEHFEEKEMRYVNNRADQAVEKAGTGLIEDL